MQYITKETGMRPLFTRATRPEEEAGGENRLAACPLLQLAHSRGMLVQELHECTFAASRLSRDPEYGTETIASEPGVELTAEVRGVITRRFSWGEDPFQGIAMCSCHVILAIMHALEGQAVQDKVIEDTGRCSASIGSGDVFGVNTFQPFC